MSVTGHRLKAAGKEARLLFALRVLPRRVGWFYWRAHRHAIRTRDIFSLNSAARPRELAELLRLARGRGTVVELGTGSGWSAMALALDDRERRVVTYDPCAREQREAYLALAGADASGRIDFRLERDSQGPRGDDALVELLFVDSEHEREPVASAFLAWKGALAPGAVVAFHDYGHPEYPGVRQAIDDLGLAGRGNGGLFVWQSGGRPTGAVKPWRDGVVTPAALVPQKPRADDRLPGGSRAGWPPLAAP